jgi:cytochrome c oxidase assembly protein subunit 11
MAQTSDGTDKKGITVGALLGILVGMGILVYYSVPLYELFCRVTGYGGTTQRATAEPKGPVSDRVLVIRFDATTTPGLPWYFYPVQKEVKVRVGERRIVHYMAENHSGKPVTGTATFNVTPAKAGRYFSKIQCFCFTKQQLKAGEKMRMPVSFFVDPGLLKDRNLDDVGVITLSYTFFRSREQADAKR